MNPYSTEFQKRREIENALAPLVDAQVRLMPIVTRMVQRARTDIEAHDIKEIIAVRSDIDLAIKRIAELHVNARPTDE